MSIEDFFMSDLGDEGKKNLEKEVKYAEYFLLL